MNREKEKICALIGEAEDCIPVNFKPDLPPGKYVGDAPEWYDFEFA